MKTDTKFTFPPSTFSTPDTSSEAHGFSAEDIEDVMEETGYDDAGAISLLKESKGSVDDALDLHNHPDTRDVNNNKKKKLKTETGKPAWVSDDVLYLTQSEVRPALRPVLPCPAPCLALPSSLLCPVP